MTERTTARHTVVLVIEDQPILRLMAVDLVEDQGFECLEAANADDALRILHERSDVRIVFSDIMLGRGLDGMKLAALIRHRWPPIEIIITSALTVPDGKDLPERSMFFAQPYRRDQVAAALHRMAA